MKELVLKKYLMGEIQAEKLNDDVTDSLIQTGYDTSQLNVEIIESEGEFEITSTHLIKLTNDTLNNHISVKNLSTIASAIEFSEFFTYDESTIDGEKVSRVLFEWDNEEIAYSITKENLKLWNAYLKTGEHKIKQ